MLLMLGKETLNKRWYNFNSFLRSVWFLYVDVSNRLLPAPLSLFIRQTADPVNLEFKITTLFLTLTYTITLPSQYTSPLKQSLSQIIVIWEPFPDNIDITWLSTFCERMNSLWLGRTVINPKDIFMVSYLSVQILVYLLAERLESGGPC
jgi:hypothetical protein